MSITLAFEWLGTVFSMFGALIIANQGRRVYLGWCAFIAANVFSIGFAINAEHYGILTQQLFFLGTSVLGLWRSNGAKRT